MEFVVCIDDRDYPASLQTRKVYRVLTDENSAAYNLIRVIDESGEDYLYPSSLFMPIELSESLKQVLACV